MKKQIIAATAAAVICIGAIGGTFAWLTSTPDAVTNTFTVGNNVVITLDEAPVNELGEPKEGDRVTGNAYKLIPGRVYTKDPTVHVDADSETCYVFIHVENGIAGIEAAGDGTYSIMADQIGENWTAVTGHEGYYYWTAGAVDPDIAAVDLEIFSEFKVDEALAMEDLQTYMEGHSGTASNIVITACAVQADGFKNAEAAAAALPAEFMP